jgi:SAM-dependent methyltransferase
MSNEGRPKRPAGSPTGIRDSFDIIAEAYARVFGNELASKPFDLELLRSFAGDTPIADGGPGARPRAVDLGTGAAGHIGRVLHEHGWAVTGIDWSARSVEVARQLNPGMDFRVADLRSLPLADCSIDAVTAFYSLIYGSDEDIVAGLMEARRVLRSGGRLLAAVHGARDNAPTSEHFDEFEGQVVDITVRITTPATFARLAEQAGLSVDSLRVRDPYGSEHPTRRIYLLAHREPV